MKFLKKLACVTAVAMSFASAANAVVLNDWFFNPVGGGLEKAQEINEYLDVNGNAFIKLTPTGGSSFSFTEHAVFNITQADGNGGLFPVNYVGGNITVMFTATGKGNFNGEFTFSGGSVRMYQNPINNQYAGTEGIYGANQGNLIAKFEVLGGGGIVDASGLPTRNGEVSVFAKAGVGDLDAGYFFDNKGNDLSQKSILAYAFTNANTVGEPTTRLIDEVACQYAGFTSAGCSEKTYSNVPGKYFFVSNNGQFKLDVAPSDVPEPGSLALFGIAMLGAGIASRKRAHKA